MTLRKRDGLMDHPNAVHFSHPRLVIRHFELFSFDVPVRAPLSPTVRPAEDDDAHPFQFISRGLIDGWMDGWVDRWLATWVEMVASRRRPCLALPCLANSFRRNRCFGQCRRSDDSVLGQEPDGKQKRQTCLSFVGNNTTQPILTYYGQQEKPNNSQ